MLAETQTYQADNLELDIERTIAVHNGTHCTLAGSRELEMHAYHLDPTNRCNLLYFCEFAPERGIRLREITHARAHYPSAIGDIEPCATTSAGTRQAAKKLGERIVPSAPT